MSEPTSSRAVIRAVRDLGCGGHWPTIEEVASYLETPAEDVRQALLDLRRKRIYRDRMRSGRRVWMPWGTVE